MDPANDRRPRLAFVVAASVAGTVAVVGFPTGLVFAVVFAVAVGVGSWSMVRRWTLWGASGNVWSGALVGFVTAASILAGQSLPVPLDVRLAVGFLVLAVGVASAALAIEFAYEATDDGSAGEMRDAYGPGRADSDLDGQ
ncbi:hypothetical protein SAMN04487948_14113 [Halogranum amylolyticum]|uniref:Uncharacterized protein n=1 Tax=Halogranum amylolyticum TaxID=660520 RepID=A0A1H8WT71_9EURY|nr:hypothetical protein [Halogranum amylolyticum]SEP30822.1 hypothetical protein SAMN04487948_14113 [Halogranum amylolyticum]